MNDDVTILNRSHESGNSVRRPLAFGIQLSALLVCLLCGCAGYRMGADSLFPPNVRTVYVPMFESNSFRRNFGERLTEAVVKEIEGKSTMKVVGSPEADSVLTGRILSETKRIAVESPSDGPRQVEVALVVQVTWADRRGDLMMDEQIPLPPELADVTQSAMLVPEVGQSLATAQQQAIQRMAEQIVGLMEVAW
jgi:hypothetical protein